MHRSEHEINGGIGSPRRLGVNGGDVWVRSSEPSDKCRQVGNIHRSPVQVLGTQELPESFQMLGCGPNRVRRSPQIIKKREIGKDRLNGLIRVVEHEPGHVLPLWKADTLYLHR